MFVFGEIFFALAHLANFLGTALYVLIIARIIISWVNADPYNPIVQFIFQITEPVLGIFRRIPLQIGMIDLTSIIAIFCIAVAQRVIVGVLVTFGQYFGSAPGI